MATEMSDRNFADGNEFKAVAERLGRLPTVKQFDEKEEPQGWTIVNALSDMEGSFRTLTKELFPKLKDATLSGEQLQDVLWDICEELRHIHYHLTDTRYFEPYLSDARDTPDDQVR
jgi:hypothetical protein